MAHFTGWSWSELMNEIPLPELNKLYKAAGSVYTKMNTPAKNDVHA